MAIGAISILDQHLEISQDKEVVAFKKAGRWVIKK